MFFHSVVKIIFILFFSCWYNALSFELGEHWLETIPATLGWRGSLLLSQKQALADGTASKSTKAAFNAMHSKALKLSTLQYGRSGINGPWSVTMQKYLHPPSGDIHDFVSIATYVWPCNAKCNTSEFKDCSHWNDTHPVWTGCHHPCNKTTGLPWCPHDGYGNPFGEQDPNMAIDVIDFASILALDWWFTSNITQANIAAKVLKTWFLNEKTRMNPNMNFSQFTPGLNTGSNSGLILADHRWNVLLADTVTLLSQSGALTLKDQKEMIQWCTEFLDWMLNSKLGREEGNSRNNHFTWYSLFAISQSLMVGNPTQAQKLAAGLIDGKTGSLPNQIFPNGSMPFELARVAGATYSQMNMNALLTAAEIITHVPKAKDVYTFINSTGFGSIRHALDFLVPYATGAKEWPYHTEKPNWTDLAPMLQRAAVAYQNPVYEQTIEQLPWEQGKWPSQWYKDLTNLVWPYTINH